MILPQFYFCIQGKQYFVRQKAALRLREITCSHFSQGKLVQLSMCDIPALLTRTSTLPNLLTVYSTILLQSAGFVRSAKMQKGVILGYLVQNYLTVLFISYSEANPLRMTLNPFAAREWAIARPIPLREPVTKATLLVQLNDRSFTQYQWFVEFFPKFTYLQLIIIKLITLYFIVVFQVCIEIIIKPIAERQHGIIESFVRKWNQKCYEPWFDSNKVLHLFIRWRGGILLKELTLQLQFDSKKVVFLAFQMTTFLFLSIDRQSETAHRKQTQHLFVF